MRNISAALTKDVIRESARRVAAGLPPVKDVTRRMGWLNLAVGERLQVCEKCQGLKPGEKPVRICVIEVVSVRRESLWRFLEDSAYAQEEVRREGFNDITPIEFCVFFCKSHKGCHLKSTVTRIEFKYVV